MNEDMNRHPTKQMQRNAENLGGRATDIQLLHSFNFSVC